MWTGRISPAAIVGNKIDSERAQIDLASSLDTKRQNISKNPRPLGNPDIQPSLDRRRKAETEIAELKAKLAQFNLNVASGKWILVEEFERQHGRELSEFIADQEHFLFDVLAKDVAAKNNLDWRLVAAFIRKNWREFRARHSQSIDAEITASR